MLEILGAMVRRSLTFRCGQGLDALCGIPIIWLMAFAPTICDEFQSPQRSGDPLKDDHERSLLIAGQAFSVTKKKCLEFYSIVLLFCATLL